ncbi:unnamed protein product [Peronospora belbahrii]|uniref:ATP synthase mitochondrial F1 complex assembly factor 1 n=1 Tax=Peronospora belbahrii TaxID=622444 RepID=A0AAU9L7A9_9STRA|nr:unnamed protein product [Peronospora belbahrii]CAH0518520.1 unnamed protein product [Peronospora belbahrii]
MSLPTLRLGRYAFSLSHHGSRRRHIASIPSATGFSYPGARSLDQIVKLELLEKEETPEIRCIWEEFHAHKRDAVATTLDATEFHTLAKRATVAPYCIFPVYRQKGFFNMLCQYQQSCFLVTYLEAFKENPTAAPPCVAISLYDNLLREKELTLVRGDVINMLDKKETQVLLQQILLSYQQEELYNHVDTFNNRPDQFDFEAYRLLLKDMTEEGATTE